MIEVWKEELRKMSLSVINSKDKVSLKNKWHIIIIIAPNEEN
jgi:hypothetical protein